MCGFYCYLSVCDCVIFYNNVDFAVLLVSNPYLIHYFLLFFFLMIPRPPRSPQSRSSAASDVYKRQYDRSFTTDKNGEIFIEGLRIGEYTVSEVSDNVSAGYVLPADKKASVKVGSTTVVEMHNVLRDTPKTGDNSKVGLWTALAGLSALGIAGTAFVALRKKKKEDDE